MGRTHEPEGDTATKQVLPLDRRTPGRYSRSRARPSISGWKALEQAQQLPKLEPAEVFDAAPAPPVPPRHPLPRPELLKRKEASVAE
jgi:hypothetical protein